MKRKLTNLLSLLFCIFAVQLFAHCKCKEDCSCKPQCSCTDTLYDDYRHPSVTVFEEGLDKDRPLLFLNIETIYWSPKQGPLFDLSILSSPNRVDIILPHSEMRWGLKAGAGIYIEEIAGNLAAKYTRLDNKGNKGKYHYTNTDPEIYSLLKTGNAYANLFNRLDLTLSRTFCGHELFQISPKAGLMLGLDHQWYDVTEEPVPTESASVALDGNSFISDQKWRGIGPYAGFETSFRLPTRSFDLQGEASIFFNVGTSLPWANTRANYSIYHYVDSVTNPEPLNNWIQISPGKWAFNSLIQTASFWSMQLLAEMALGIQYEQIFGSSGDGTKLSVFAAWEEQYWPNHILNIEYSQTIDYQTQGFTLGGKLQY